jgi:hypothetical protein
MTQELKTSLDPQCSLLVECESAKFHVEAKSKEIQVHVAHRDDLRYLYQLKSVPLPGSMHLGKQLHRLFTDWGLTLMIVHEGRLLAQIGVEATPGLLGRWLGFPGLQIRLFNSLRLLKD